MIYTYENLRKIVDNSHTSKTIASNTIIIGTSVNNIRVVLHGNPIFDLYKDNYDGFVYMRILPDAYSWFTNTTQTRIGLICSAYGFKVTRKNKPEKRFIIEKQFYRDSVYSLNRRVVHVVYADSYPFPLNDLYRREHNNNARGYTGNLVGDYIYESS